MFCTGSGASAKAFISNGGITVVSGLVVSDHVVPSFEIRGKNYLNLRRHLGNDGTIKDGVFQKDYEFSAPSAASAVILGRNSNRKDVWKSEDETKLKDIL